ncbi:DUF3592 domain-containing protein [Rhizobium sp. P40RR-XXII]|uniref:DUF3592 domain-containing protein n=1 Tax=Rhizobium sp. P40RR-XXII TaxID=2726739 RepID=UPI001456917E|nr:DUF3592 domain-containing protein [Rhizobium sp. P40RR-XXII]NLS18718.1 DUF3592 domain-containing protein [Rhizobium sp. P40RR-XXII]
MPDDNQHHVSVRRGGHIVLIIGLLLLVPGIVAFGHSLGFAMQAQRAEGIFEGAIERNTSYGVMYYPKFTFRTTDGREASFTSGIGSTSQVYAPGSRLAILYDPAHPDHARADSLFGVWLPSVILLPPAFLVVLIGTVILLR